ncbi:hypothetical protein AB1Y20_008240 [Prymnesium parvum]|uniref:39S ribosomal protein L59, mitochondrial n=1 Tax=Prymnesium parvum TaxID=97485 RepID=A0AB34IWL4_PRYPA
MADIVGDFASPEMDVAARDLWCSRLGFTQGLLTLPKDKVVGGGMLPRAPPLIKLNDARDPGRMIKDWSFYKYRPYNSDLTCSLNKYGPDFRWPGMNNTPVYRHHLALVERKPPKHPLPEKYWSGMPKLEIGPGHDFIYEKEKALAQAEKERMAQFYANMRRTKTQIAAQRKRREHLEALAGVTASRATRSRPCE